MSSRCPLCNIKLEDLYTWKDPKKTLIALAIFNFSFIFIKCLNISTISLILNSLIYFTIFKLIMANFAGEQSNSASKNEIKEETITKMYTFLYDTINKTIDEVRAICLLSDKGNTLRKIILLVLVRWISSFFSTMTFIVLMVDVLILLNYGNMYNIMKETVSTVLEQIGRIINEKIPKYSEPPKFQ